MLGVDGEESDDRHFADVYSRLVQIARRIYQKVTRRICSECQPPRLMASSQSARPLLRYSLPLSAFINKFCYTMRQSLSLSLLNSTPAKVFCLLFRLSALLCTCQVPAGGACK